MIDVVLYQPEIPPNTGNIIRLCANTGSRLHLIGPLGFSLDDRQLRRAGLDYYPKLVAALPFTPVPGARLLIAPDADREAVAGGLLGAARDLADDAGASSLHVLFPSDDEHPLLTASGLALRKDCQFHWRNRGFESFDAYLATFSSKKRKQVRRERRIVATQGFEGPFNARWAVEELGKKRLATIYINNDWGVDANKYFVEEARRLGAEVVAEEAFTPGEKDFNAILSKLKRLE